MAAIVKTDIEIPWASGKLAFHLDNVYTEEECNDLIKLSEKEGYGEALVNIGGGRQMSMKDVRNSERCIIDSEEMAGELFRRIEAFLPKIFDGHEIISLNERLRFLRYDPGQYFLPHRDGCYIRPDYKEASFLTVQLYLNEGFQGGDTTFLSSNEKQKVPCVPKIGRVLVFQHNLYHEGSLLLSGRKYCIRTDVMYTYHEK